MVIQEFTFDEIVRYRSNANYDTDESLHLSMTPKLPDISNAPQKYSDCCLSISDKLLAQIASFAPSSTILLSIGCGTGLLEALLRKHHQNCSIEGVEVYSASNLTQYLPSGSLNTVSGTWDLSDRAFETRAWMFVYPREPRLVEQYLERYSAGAARMVLWLGPIVDWQDYEQVFSHAPKDQRWTTVNTRRGAEAGLLPYEMMAWITKDGPLG